MILVAGATGLVGSALSEVLASGRRPWLEVARGVADDRSAAASPDEGPRRVAAADVTIRDSIARHFLEGRPVRAVIHLAGVAPGTKPARPDAELAAMRTLVELAQQSKVERFVFLSATGASKRAAHPWLRAKGEAEELLRASGLPFVIVRAGLVTGAGSRPLNALMEVVRSGRRIRLPLLRGGRFLPIAAGDVAITLAAALDHHRLKDAVLEVGAPPELTLEKLLDLLARRLGRKLALARWPFTGRSLAASLRRVPAPLTDADSLVGWFAVAEPPSLADYDRLLPMRRTSFVEELRGYPWGRPPPRPGDPLPTVGAGPVPGLPLFIPGPHLREEGEPELPSPRAFGQVDPFGRVEGSEGGEPEPGSDGSEPDGGASG